MALGTIISHAHNSGQFRKEQVIRRLILSVSGTQPYRRARISDASSLGWLRRNVVCSRDDVQGTHVPVHVLHERRQLYRLFV